MKPEELPTVLPLFSLEQPLLLPGTVVPFAATEQGERNLVDDAMAAEGYVAIVQPIDEGSPAARALGPAGRRSTRSAASATSASATRPRRTATWSSPAG